jgi:hypothetical protein
MQPVTFDDLAHAVISADGFNRQTSLAQVRHILEVALKSKLALPALSAPVTLDLGNGHCMTCTVALARAN